MLSLPPYIFLLGALTAWLGLTVSWSRHIHALSEQRRKEAAANGETPPDVKGASNYERAEIREQAHRAQKVTPKEKWTGRAITFAVPALIFSVFILNSVIY